MCVGVSTQPYRAPCYTCISVADYRYTVAGHNYTCISGVYIDAPLYAAGERIFCLYTSHTLLWL